MDRLDRLAGQPPAGSTQQRADIVVFACGDPAHAEHDSVAIAACKGLPPEVLERIDLKISGPMRPEYLRDLSADSFVIVADTMPGTPEAVVEVPFIDLVGRVERLMTSSTPDQGLDEIVAMAELLREEPLRGRFIGLTVEAIDLSAPADASAVEQLRDSVARAIKETDQS